MAVEMKYGDYIRGGLDIVKANLVPSCLLLLIIIVTGFVPILGTFIAQIWVVNFMAAVKAAKHEGKPIEIGSYFNFDNAVDKLVAPAIHLILSGLCFLIMPLTMWAAPIIADKPGTPFMSALKASMAFGKANYVSSLIFGFIIGILVILSLILCVLPAFVMIPVAQAAIFLAYDSHRSAIEAAAAEGGVKL